MFLRTSGEGVDRGRETEAKGDLEVARSLSSAVEQITARSPAAPASDSPPALGIADGMTTNGTYAFLVAMRESRRPGALAIVTSVQEACRAGMGSLMAYRDHRYADVVRANVIRTTGSLEAGEALRVQYAQLIQARCQDARGTELEQPMPGDPYGEKIAEARKKEFSRTYPVEAFIAMIEQGQLAAIHEGLALWPYFEGVYYSVDSEDFRIYGQAMRIAAFRATSDPASQNPDLRLMAGCLADGICDGRIESLELQGWPEGAAQRGKALALAEKMTRAFQQNDLRPFLPRKKKSG